MLAWEEMINVTGKLQFVLSSKLMARTADRFDSKYGPIKAINRLASSKEGGAVFGLCKREEHCFPKDGEEINAKLMWSIGFITTMRCPCGLGESYANADGYHLSSQCNIGGGRTISHDALKKEVANLARAAGYRVKLESSAAMHVSDRQQKNRYFGVWRGKSYGVVGH